MATLEVGDQVVGYAVEGSGATPVLLLHGTTMSRTAWDMVRASMPGDVDVTWVMVEFPGSGESSMPATALTVEALADQAAAVMAHLGHQRYHVAGYSLGAAVAAAVAARYAASVSGAVLLCGWAAADARMRVTFDLWKRLIAADPELFMRYVVADGYTAEAIAGLEPMLDAVVAMGAGTLAPGSHAHLDLDIALDITPLLGSISAPTLVIGAEHDRWVDVRHSHALAAAIPGARLEVLPAGHLVIQELAAEVARLSSELWR